MANVRDSPGRAVTGLGDVANSTLWSKLDTIHIFHFFWARNSTNGTTVDICSIFTEIFISKVDNSIKIVYFSSSKDCWLAQGCPEAKISFSTGPRATAWQESGSLCWGLRKTRRISSELSLLKITKGSLLGLATGRKGSGWSPDRGLFHPAKTKEKVCGLGSRNVLCLRCPACISWRGGTAAVPWGCPWWTIDLFPRFLHPQCYLCWLPCCPSRFQSRFVAALTKKMMILKCSCDL